jgi:DNA-binding NarL/FixJ family response regulator
VIILSGSCDAPFAKIAIDAGAFGYLEKPCSLADLEAKVRLAIDQRGDPQEPIPPSLRAHSCPCQGTTS